MSHHNPPFTRAERRSLLRATVALVGTGILALTTVITVAPAASASPSALETPSVSGTQGLNYVALGDSYAAGFGIDPSTLNPVPGCGQSTQNYPHQVAAELELALTDVSCSAAITDNITTTPQVTGSGTAPVQISALSDETDVVSLTIGGNDLGFADIASSCIALGPTGPLADQVTPDCASTYVAGGIDQLALHTENVVAPKVAATLTAIKHAAPHAKIFVVGYPSITPDVANTPPAGCFTPALTPSGEPPYPVNSFPFTNVDTEYLFSVEQGLNDAIQDQAVTAGATYVSAFAGSAAHSACAAPDDAFINGVSLISLSPFDIVAGALHPNAAGTAFLASLLASEIVAAFPNGTAAPTALPDTSAPPTPVPSATPPTTSSAEPIPSTPGTSAPVPTASDSATPPNDAQLAATGVNVGLPLAGGLMVIALGALVVARTRRTRATSSNGTSR